MVSCRGVLPSLNSSSRYIPHSKALKTGFEVQVIYCTFMTKVLLTQQIKRSSYLSVGCLGLGAKWRDFDESKKPPRNGARVSSCNG